MCRANFARLFQAVPQLLSRAVQSNVSVVRRDLEFLRDHSDCFLFQIDRTHERSVFRFQRRYQPIEAAAHHVCFG